MPSAPCRSLLRSAHSARRRISQAYRSASMLCVLAAERTSEAPISLTHEALKTRCSFSYLKTTSIEPNWPRLALSVCLHKIGRSEMLA